MATKHVKETLGEFQDWRFFSILEAKSEDKDVDEKAEKEEEAKDGAEAINKLRDNLSRFETAAGGKILKYKEFFEENKDIADQFDEDGDMYKMWDSDYVAGVLILPDEALSDEEINAQIQEIDAEEGDGDDDTEEKDEKDEKGEEKEDDEDDEDEDDKDEDEDDKDEDDKDEDEDDEKEDDDDDELEEGNAFSGALKKAKDKGKKKFKVGKKTYPVKEGMDYEEFSLVEEETEDINETVIEKYRKLLLEKAEEDEGELPADDVVTPDEESDEEKKETDEEGFAGFEVPDDETDLGDLDGDGINEPDSEEVAVEDGEAVELDDEFGLNGDGEGDLEFGEDGGSSEYFVIFDTAGGGREEVFRTDNPKIIEEFKDFYENGYKAAIQAQIQAYKEAQEEKKREAERRAKEELRKERREKLDKFMGESVTQEKKFLREDFDEDPYDEEFVLDRNYNGIPDYEEDDSMMGNPNDDLRPNEEFYPEDDMDTFENEIVSILIDEYGLEEGEAEILVAEQDLEEAFEMVQDPDIDFSIEDFIAGLYEKYEYEG